MYPTYTNWAILHRNTKITTQKTSTTGTGQNYEHLKTMLSIRHIEHYSWGFGLTEVRFKRLFLYFWLFHNLKTFMRVPEADTSHKNNKSKEIYIFLHFYYTLHVHTYLLLIRIQFRPGSPPALFYMIELP